MTNHRQVGTARTGLLISGTKDPKLNESIETFKKTAPSIPSKHSTRSGRYKGEKNGFGGRTYRFRKEDNNVQPGPGYYHTSASLEKSSGSVSARGEDKGGGMAGIVGMTCEEVPNKPQPYTCTV